MYIDIWAEEANKLHREYITSLETEVPEHEPTETERGVYENRGN